MYGRDEERKITIDTGLDVELVPEDDEGEAFVRVCMTPVQAAAIVETLDLNLDFETISLDNDEPRRAMFMGMLREALRKAID